MIQSILDSKYEKADLNTVMSKQCQHLNAAKRYSLITLLNKFEYLFDGTLGTWKTTPVDLKLKYNVDPVCSRPYPVPRVHKAMFKSKSKYS